MRRTLNFHFHRVQFDFHFTVARIDVIKRLKIGRTSPLRSSDRRRGEAGGSKTPTHRSPAWVSRDNDCRNRNAMIPDMAGMGQMCPGALVAVQSDQ